MSVSHLRRGTGPALVLVHGIGSRWQVFEPVIDALAATHDVIAVDLPGFGASPFPAGLTPGPRQYAAWLAGWLGELGVQRPHVVGSSMGGAIALEMARHRTAARVTAFSPAGFWAKPGRIWCQGLVTAMRDLAKVGGRPLDLAVGVRPLRAAAAAPMFGRPARTTPAQVRADLAALKDATGFEQARASFADYTFADAAELGDTPVTIAWGTRDVLLTHRSQSRRARTLLPDARHVDLPGCGHLPFSDDPELCIDTITS